MDIIAQRTLWAIQPGGRAHPLDVQIGRPYEISADEWACPVQLIGLHSKLKDTHGGDSFQSLMLAQNLARTLLAAFVEDGGTLLDSPEGKPIDVQSLFMTGVSLPLPTHASPPGQDARK